MNDPTNALTLAMELRRARAEEGDALVSNDLLTRTAVALERQRTILVRVADLELICPKLADDARSALKE